MKKLPEGTLQNRIPSEFSSARDSGTMIGTRLRSSMVSRRGGGKGIDGGVDGGDCGVVSRRGGGKGWTTGLGDGESVDTGFVVVTCFGSGGIGCGALISLSIIPLITQPKGKRNTTVIKAPTGPKRSFSSWNNQSIFDAPCFTTLPVSEGELMIDKAHESNSRQRASSHPSEKLKIEKFNNSCVHLLNFWIGRLRCIQ
jgi:hypothetical protein